MRNLSRTLALTAALVLAGLTTTVSAQQTLGSCRVRCLGTFPPSSYTVTTTKADCCSGNYPNHCPAGTTPVTGSWNNTRCTSM